MNNTEINLIFPSEKDKNLFLEHVLPTKSEVRLSMNENAQKNLKYFLKDVNILKQDIGIWEVLTVLVTGGTLSVIISNIKDIVTKYLDISKSRIIIEKEGRRLVFEFKNKKQLREILNDDTIKSIFVPKEQSK